MYQVVNILLFLKRLVNLTNGKFKITCVSCYAFEAPF